MAPTKAWETIPSADFASKLNWRSLGENRYAALRVRLLILQTNGSELRFGRVMHAVNVAPHDSIAFRSKRSRVISQTTTITEAIRFATASRVCEKLAAKVSAELGGKLAGFAGKLSTELLASTDYEITSTLESTLTGTASYAIQDTEEEEVTITLTGGAEPRVAELRRRYWPRRWDVYLHSYDYYELSHKSSWFLGDVVKTIKEVRSGALGWPLGSATFYEPQPGLDVCYNAIDELDDPEGIGLSALSADMPRSIAPEAELLEDLARLAFSVTKEDRARASLRGKKAAPKKAAKKAAAGKKKVSAKKKSASKAAAKKSARPARKSAARRGAF